jgi:hypothetical protein
LCTAHKTATCVFDSLDLQHSFLFTGWYIVASTSTFAWQDAVEQKAEALKVTAAPAQETPYSLTATHVQALSSCPDVLCIYLCMLRFVAQRVASRT